MSVTAWFIIILIVIIACLIAAIWKISNENRALRSSNEDQIIAKGLTERLDKTEEERGVVESMEREVEERRFDTSGHENKIKRIEDADELDDFIFDRAEEG